MNTPATVPMIATVRQTYNTRALKSGDEFDALNEGDAADLVAVRMATRAKPKARLLTPTSVAATAAPATAPAAELPASAVLTTRNLEAKSSESSPTDEDDAPADEVVAPIETNARSGYNRRDVRPKR